MTANPEMILRCPWTGIEDPEYARYHDEEWGVPMVDDRALFEKLTLEGFQAGLSWLTILRKRDNFRRAFRNFEAQRVARFTSKDVERLMADEGIVRNRAKIEAAISNAQAFLALSKRVPFSAFLWSFVAGRPIINEVAKVGNVPPSTEISKKLSKALKAEGFRFVGPTGVYAFMQSTGMVNDHLVSCPRHAKCAALQRKLRVAGL